MQIKSEPICKWQHAECATSQIREEKKIGIFIFENNNTCFCWEGRKKKEKKKKKQHKNVVFIHGLYNRRYF